HLRSGSVRRASGVARRRRPGGHHLRARRHAERRFHREDRSRRARARRAAPSRAMKVHPYGDGALYVDLEIADAPDRAERTHAVGAGLRDRRPKADVVVGAGSVALVGIGAWDDVEGLVAEAMQRRGPSGARARVHRIEVVYDGPDLEEVAAMTGLAPAAVGEL